MIWLKVLLALIVALLAAALMCLLVQGLVTGGEKALGWLVGRARRAPAVPVERDDFALWEAECASFLQRLANRIKR